MDTRVCIGLWLQDVEATNIFLNPGLAFGTGEHPTTKLCLLFLHRLIKGGEHFLDYGTGSGVLAIAALKVLHLKKKITTMTINLYSSSISGMRFLSKDTRHDFNLMSIVPSSNTTAPVLFLILILFSIFHMFG